MISLVIEYFLAIALFFSFIVFIFYGFPVAWTMGGLGVFFIIISMLSDSLFDTFFGVDWGFASMVVYRLYGVMANWVLVALPMFIFMGLMLDKSGIAEKMMRSMQKLFGNVRGGLAITVALIGIILAASTGIIGASVVLLGVMSLPIMLKQKYNKSLALGTIAASGCLGILIPPSIMLVIMGDQLSIPILDLFMGAVFPGLILGLLYIIYILIYCKIYPEKAPLAQDHQEVNLKDVVIALIDIIPPAGLIMLVLGSIFMGIATVTEASAFGAIGSIIIAILYKHFSFGILKEVVIKTMNTAAYIFAIFVGATIFALVLRECGGDELIESGLTGLGLGPYGLIIFVLVVVFFLGFFLDWIEITLIILPLLSPVIVSLDLQINGFGVVDYPKLTWFAMLVAVTLQTSFLTPPVGFALFYLKGVCPPNVTMIDIYRGVIPFIVLQLIALVLVFLFPELVTWLPSKAFKPL